jgi:hypothetical protein
MGAEQAGSLQPAGLILQNARKLFGRGVDFAHGEDTRIANQL